MPAWLCMEYHHMVGPAHTEPPEQINKSTDQTDNLRGILVADSRKP